MPDQLRIASYNVHKAVGVDYRRSPERIARVIASLKADIVALQEVDRRLAPRPAVLSAASILRESGLVPVEVATNDVSLGWHGNALLVRDTITVRAVERLLLPGVGATRRGIGGSGNADRPAYGGGGASGIAAQIPQAAADADRL